ncbi:MAG TPA: hypothetical protein VH080_02060 [Gemmatimonadaceae bacterium]|nr:hypothetical protein [Gemmatimonadaceae bacterium]
MPRVTFDVSLVRHVDTAPWTVIGTNPALRASNRIEDGHEMSKLLRGVAAGYGAKKLGGGCFSTILIFIILWWLLGHFGIFK